MSSDLEWIKIDLETLVHSAEEDYKNEFWSNYENYLKEYNLILKKLQDNGLFKDVQPISYVPQGKKAWMSNGFTFAERAKLREIAHSSKRLLVKLEKTFLSMSDKSEQVIAPKSLDVFVVHGHDEEMKQSVARKLEKLSHL